MALLATQVATVAEMVGETQDAVNSALASLARAYSETDLTAIENLLADDASTYEDLRGKGHLKVKGGKDGIDLDYERRLEKLRIDNRVRLGLPAYSEADYARDPNAIRSCVLQGVRW